MITCPNALCRATFQKASLKAPRCYSCRTDFAATPDSDGAGAASSVSPVIPAIGTQPASPVRFAPQDVDRSRPAPAPPWRTNRSIHEERIHLSLLKSPKGNPRRPKALQQILFFQLSCFWLNKMPPPLADVMAATRAARGGGGVG